MAEVSDKPTPTKPTTPSKDTLLKHLEQVEQVSINNQAGKIGCNPFVWVRDNVTPLVDALKAAKDVPSELASKITSLKALEVPKDK